MHTSPSLLYWTSSIVFKLTTSTIFLTRGIPTLVNSLQLCIHVQALELSSVIPYPLIRPDLEPLFLK